MVSTLNLEEKYNKVRKHFCFYIDVQDHGLARSLSRRLEDMGLQQEVFLTARVTHVVRDTARCSAGRSRADAMLQRVRPPPTLPSTVVQLTVQKAISLLDKLYDTFFPAPRKANIKYFTKHYIKIEFLDKLCRPVCKEFDVWPEISLEPDPPKEKKDKNSPAKISNDINQNHQTAQKMTRKSRPRLKEREDKEVKGGYCEMCHCDYVDAALHRRSPHHTAFVRDTTNFLALDSLIGAGADVATFLDKATPINGERRSLRNTCNGDDKARPPASPVNGRSPRQYYKVVGVSTKLRSSGGFVPKRKESPVTCNGAKPLVVKFRKVRRSELSVLSDEAEQFMFPKRASSTSSTSSDEDEKPVEASPRRKSPPLSIERRRLARPLALKEESSEEDGWPEDPRRRKRRAGPAVKRGRRIPLKPKEPEIKPKEPEMKAKEPDLKPEPEPEPPPAPAPVEPLASPLREEPIERCMKWEDGRLKYTPAVEQLEFAFESVPRSEPWFETFQRQDQDKIATKNVPNFFALYTTKSPKLPYEIGQLPPLKPNCCPLSDLVKRDDKAGPSRSYGTRGMKKQKIRKRVAALVALDERPRKSPREHASTRAMLGPRPRLRAALPLRLDDTRSTGTVSDDTSDTPSASIRLDPVPPSITGAGDASERMQQFLSEVFDDAADYDVSEDAMDGEPALATSNTAPDVSSLVSECDGCDLIRDEIESSARARKSRRGKFKKKNRTGWPNKRKPKKDSRTNSFESAEKAESLDRSSAEPAEDDTTRDAISEEDGDLTDNTAEDVDTELEKTLVEKPEEEEEKPEDKPEEEEEKPEEMEVDESLDEGKQTKRTSRSSASDPEEREERRRKKRALAGLLLQPVVRVARVDPNAARRLRSAARGVPARSRLR